MHTTLLFATLLVQQAPDAGVKPMPPWQLACKADYEKLCKEEAKKGDPRQCLADHENELSEECTKKFLNGYRIITLCRTDMEKHCSGRKDLGVCMKEHDADLSKDCKGALVKGSKQAKAEAKAEAKADQAEEKKEDKKETPPASDKPAPKKKSSKKK